MRIVLTAATLALIGAALGSYLDNSTWRLARADGETVYRKDCARCHGAAGEGVAGHYETSLYGDRSIESLTRYIGRTMPEDEPGKYKDTPAASNVAAYIHRAFYSREARRRNNPVRYELARLTAPQYRTSVADLFAGFLPGPPRHEGEGLKAEYRDYHKVGDKQTRDLIFERVDPVINPDFGAKPPDDRIKTGQYSVHWKGSLWPEETGWYEFRVMTYNGVRLFLNQTKDPPSDSPGLHKGARIDGRVVSGTELRTLVGRFFLIAGRPHPIELEFIKGAEARGRVRLEWKPPHGAWSLVPKTHLSPAWSPVVAALATDFPADDRGQGYERGTSISEEWVQSVTEAALEGADFAVAHLGQLAGKPVDTEKARTFCSTFASRAFRRAWSPDDESRWITPAFTNGADPSVAVRATIFRVLSSPDFLYPESTPGEPDPWSIASRLALTLWDSVPDKPLREAAQSGSLRDPAAVRAQAERMIASPLARPKIRGFFAHWLALEEGDQVSKDPSLFPGFSDELWADARASLNAFVSTIFWSETSDYRDLFRSPTLPLNQRLARFYGGTADGEDLQPVTFPADERAGVFTHPYLLGTFAYPRQTSPIRRGVFVNRHLLGRFLKPPPKAFAFPDDQFPAHMTMREKTAQLTSETSCMVCHVLINPPGFALEAYDAAGRHRRAIDGKPVQTASEYPTGDGQVLEVSAIRDLAEYAATSERTRHALVEKLVQYLAKQPVGAFHPTFGDELDAYFAERKGHLRELAVEIAARVALHSHSLNKTTEDAVEGVAHLGRPRE